MQERILISTSGGSINYSWLPKRNSRSYLLTIFAILCTDFPG